MGHSVRFSHLFLPTLNLPLVIPDVPPGIRLLGLAGAPGVGKSTLAAALGLPVVPMDGFHYADVELERRGLLDRKGAPETFDAEGYAALLRRVRTREPDVVAPMFERDLEQPIAAAIPVPAAGTVVTEGNYLLLDEPRWHAVRAEIDVVWHLEVDDDVRVERLVARHVAFGKSLAAAREWVARVDEANARLVEAARSRADLVVDVSAWALRRTPPA
ncbi:nucleoside/nucleotide kinase family protein [Nocardioides sp. MAH-18]|uniref:Nucleoside/nucleotide kinase family protein n=1 Tax=Nocardioides agri TaxID=2682843 RepID=A0A6L6XW60_9ACTN|nr:nucleoside/nucleotide kinase family protein [Nocardioides sp. MAH-18]MBA2955867.1 nucleoside/nucleotide kinase family protein [Nocardioides sp. CGMCC 1.13656]MVQ50716.1 nucleoside/nucleotide kinase family protein [Nocardioides sp. MAH-18]